ncbi:hypothetical protein PIB30_044538, partial [Stylosanthes scabra]|nr:hypothetical protein [Stylosanthes scabra]
MRPDQAGHRAYTYTRINVETNASAFPSSPRTGAYAPAAASPHHRLSAFHTHCNHPFSPSNLRIGLLRVSFHLYNHTPYTPHHLNQTPQSLLIDCDIPLTSCRLLLQQQTHPRPPPISRISFTNLILSFLHPYNLSALSTSSSLFHCINKHHPISAPNWQPFKFGVEARSSLADMSSSSSEEGDILDEHCFRSLYNQKLFAETVSNKEIIHERGFDCDEEYLEVKEQIYKRGWRRLVSPRTEVIKNMIREFYANANRSREEMEELQ